MDPHSNTASYAGMPGQIASATGNVHRQSQQAGVCQNGLGSPGPAVTMNDLIIRGAALLDRIRNLAEGVDILNDRLTGPSPQPNAIKNEGTSAMPGSLGEMAHLLHLQHATLDRAEVGMRRLHELQG